MYSIRRDSDPNPAQVQNLTPIPENEVSANSISPRIPPDYDLSISLRKRSRACIKMTSMH